MIELHISSAIAGLIAVAIATLLINFFANKLSKKAIKQPPLLKRYWFFVVPFLTITVSAYSWALLVSASEVVFDVIGQVGGLIFAAVVGYFAFAQLVESRFDKLTEDAQQQLHIKHYQRALKLHQEALSIKPKDLTTLFNLLELYLVTENRAKFKATATQVEPLLLDESDYLINYCLHALDHLLAESMKSARQDIAEIVKYAVAHPDAVSTFSWSFSELKGSNIYKKLEGDSRKMLDNCIAYLERTLTDEARASFEDGDYVLARMKEVKS